MKSKRGQGLPLNTIVIAAIVLIVLVVIIMIFTGGMGGFVKGLKKDCVNELGGVCGNFRCDSDGVPANSIPITGSSCKGLEGQDSLGNKIKLDYCCVPPEE